jgi:hypothetical protein
MMSFTRSNARPNDSVADVAMFIHRIRAGVSGIRFPASSAMMISRAWAIGDNEQAGLFQVIVNPTTPCTALAMVAKLSSVNTMSGGFLGDFGPLNPHGDVHPPA